jgi:hypothetical protein
MTTEPITILVLGPMERRRNGRVTAASRTVGIQRIVEGIVKELGTLPELRHQPFEVVAPENRMANVIVHGILDLVEEAELVVIDMTGESANVAYEAGIVHALGLPHIVLTSGPRPPFYFQGAEHIARFRFKNRYDPRLATHADLRRHIRRFALDQSGGGTAYTDNQLTRYFGLPLVDVAGPSGLAAGYYRNSVNRFVRNNGFLEAPCTVVWSTSTETRDGVETKRTATHSIDIGRYVTIRPPGGLSRNHGEHTGDLRAMLEKLGYKLVFASILKRKDESQDLRDFGGQFLSPIDAPAGRPFVEPAILIDMPTTLYALQLSPRIRRLQRRGRHGEIALSTRGRRLLDQMQRSFDRNLGFHLRDAEGFGLANRFHHIDLAELPDVLLKAGVPLAT